MIDWALGLKWQDWAAAASILFGLVTLVAYLDQRKSVTENKALIEFAKRHVSKDITEEAIRELVDQQKSIQNQITQSLPRLARDAILHEQADLHAVAAAEHYEKWKQITEQLTTSQAVSKLDPAIANEVRERLLPSYLQRRERDSLQARITLYSVTLAVAGNVLPYPMSYLVVLAVTAPLVTALLRFAAHAGPEARTHAERAAFSGYIVGAVAVATCGVLIMVYAGAGWPKWTIGVGLVIIAVAIIVTRSRFRKWLLRTTRS